MNNLEREIKELIIQALNLEDITIDDISSEDPLFIDGLGLDSIDALELGIALQKKYSIKIETQDENIKKYFFSVKTIAEFVETTRVS
ncbi:MAG: acyl carrier protein [Alphaproteobacteria bacterium]|jgi:acyl carrier protein|nr:acyl carrier protein [Alphaproteobacteria bacterium]MBP7729014.1 acyl carrier protein [Alphaproteobacteria bacterium]